MAAHRLLTGNLHRIFAALFALALIATAGAAVADTWTTVGSLSSARLAHTATVLNDGRVLVVGGYGADGAVLASAELYDPATQAWSGTGSLNLARANHTATLLTNGKVLVVGGNDTSNTHVYASAELYDPATGVWSVTGSLPYAVTYHTATLLHDGRVLIARGIGVTIDPNNGLFNEPQRAVAFYDPVSGTVTSGPAGSDTGAWATATLLNDGRVLIQYSNFPELFDPVSGTTFSGLPSLQPFYQHTATLMPEGKVLLVDGQDGFPLPDAALYDPTNDRFPPTADLNVARTVHTATLLANGKVLVTGGQDSLFNPGGNLSGYRAAHGSVNNIGSTASCELYDPATNAWTLTANLATSRSFHTASLLANGQVLVTGGASVIGASGTALTSSELFTPTPPLAGIAPQSGNWWNPAEGGRGFNIEFNGSRIYMASYLYDASGRSNWYVAGPAPMIGPSFTASLDAYAGGQTLTGAYKSPAPQPSPGIISITFSDAMHGILSWPGGTIPIERYQFAANGLANPPTATQPQTGWWWNPAEGGRGYSIEVQSGLMYLATYMYDGAGNPVWYVAGPAPIVNNTFQDTWMGYSGGQTLTGTYQAPRAPTSVGSVTVQFASPTSGTLTLPDGRQIPIQRYGF
jgi:hypothetical protein